MADTIGVVAGFLVVVGLVTVAYGYHRWKDDEDDRRITRLINGNKASWRPGMARRDDDRMRAAEDRARSRRAP